MRGFKKGISIALILCMLLTIFPTYTVSEAATTGELKEFNKQLSLKLRLSKDPKYLDVINDDEKLIDRVLNDVNKEIEETYGVPNYYPKTVKVKGRTLKLNAQFLRDRRLMVYGTPQDVRELEGANDVKNNRVRYLGYDRDGTLFTNPAFPRGSSSKKELDPRYLIWNVSDSAEYLGNGLLSLEDNIKHKLAESHNARKIAKTIKPNAFSYKSVIDANRVYNGTNEKFIGKPLTDFLSYHIIYSIALITYWEMYDEDARQIIDDYGLLAPGIADYFKNAQNKSVTELRQIMDQHTTNLLNSYNSKGPTPHQNVHIVTPPTSVTWGTGYAFVEDKANGYVYRTVLLAPFIEFDDHPLFDVKITANTDVTEPGKKYQATVTYKFKEDAELPVVGIMNASHNGYVIPHIKNKGYQFEPGEELVLTFEFTGQNQPSVLYAEILGANELARMDFKSAELVIPSITNNGGSGNGNGGSGGGVSPPSSDSGGQVKDANNSRVPQWRLSRYWNNLFEVGFKEAKEASFGLEMTRPSTTHVTSYMTPSGNTTFELVNPPMGNVLHFKSKAKVVPGETLTRSITYDKFENFNTFKIYGDLFAIKRLDRDKIDNIQPCDPKWVPGNMSLAGYSIPYTLKGKEADRPARITKEFEFKYGVKNPNTYTHYRGVYSHSTDEDGRDICNCYLTQETAKHHYTTANYKVSIDFDRYIPGNTTPKDFVPKEVRENGFASITAQSPTTFKVYPEVAMLFTDPNGKNNIVFVAGDKARTIKPVSYHTLRYASPDRDINKGAKVKPNVVGQSIATDMKAKALAARMGYANVPVVYKGSGANISFAIDGDLVAKSYILDIGNPTVRSAWNPNTTYDPNKIHENFLNKFGIKGSNGKWTFNVKATENLKITGKNYGKNTKDLTLNQTNAVVRTYNLTVRGGKLVAVNGDTNFRTKLKSSNPELLKALEEMKLLDDNGVLSVFERGKGEALQESLYAQMANSARKTNDIQVGKGWYHEDSTVLVVREYVHVFKLPLVVFSDKVPMTVDGLATPIDKNQFFSKGETGHTVLRISLWSKNQGTMDPYRSVAGQKEVYMEHDSSQNTKFGNRTVDYIVPNVSILDTLR